MGAITDRLALTLDELKDFLGIAAANTYFDVRLAMWFAGAKEEADAFLNNDFVDCDGNDETIPIRITQGVIELVRLDYLRDHAQRELDQASLTVPGREGEQVRHSRIQKTSQVRRQDGTSITAFSPKASMVRQDQVPLAMARREIKRRYFGPWSLPGGF